MADTYLLDFCTWVSNRYYEWFRGYWTPEETVQYHREFVDQRSDYVLGKYTSQELLDALFLYGCTDDDGTMVWCDAIQRFATTGKKY